MHVSVIMAVYNGELTVQAAVESVLTQTYADWDLIIVNDGSTDRTSKVIDSLARKDRRVSIINNPRNLGFPASLNVGWRASKSELIALNDADDVSLPQRLERQVAFMATHPEVDVLGTGVELISQSGETLSTVLRPESHEEIVRRMYKENPFFHPTVMYRRRFLEGTGGYDPALKRSQDVDLSLRGYRRFRYHNLPEIHVRYRTRSKQSLKSIAFGAFVLLRSAWREGLLLTKGWYGFRFFAGGMLFYFGLAKSRFAVSSRGKVVSK
jgi:glycosyltransferase involved in cell wall biosynthesis